MTDTHGNPTREPHPGEIARPTPDLAADDSPPDPQQDEEAAFTADDALRAARSLRANRLTRRS